MISVTRILRRKGTINEATINAAGKCPNVFTVTSKVCIEQESMSFRHLCLLLPYLPRFVFEGYLKILSVSLLVTLQILTFKPDAQFIFHSLYLSLSSSLSLSLYLSLLFSVPFVNHLYLSLLLSLSVSNTICL